MRAYRAAILSTAVLLASAASSQANTDLLFPVTLQVGAIEMNGNGEFSLDVQLAPGTNAVTNTVTLSNFQFIGGSLDPSNVNNFSIGGVSGSMSSTLVLTNSSDIDNEFAEAFTSGVTQIKFNVDQTTNSETGINAKDEEFNVFLDDNTGNPIPTTDPTSQNTLIASVIMEGESIPDLSIHSATNPGSDAGEVTVPEPGSAVMLLCGALGLCARRRTFRRA